ncbi:uncharacterized protein ACRADG_001566 [Cochliomyia hominivorax]
MISIDLENVMDFLKKYKLLVLLCLCLLTEARSLVKREVDESPRDLEDLRTPQKYIIEPIQTLTKDSDNLIEPPYDAVDFGFVDNLNEIESKDENSNLDLVKASDSAKEVDEKISKTYELKNKENSENLVKAEISVESENFGNNLKNFKTSQDAEDDPVIPVYQNKEEEKKLDIPMTKEMKTSEENKLEKQEKTNIPKINEVKSPEKNTKEEQEISQKVVEDNGSGIELVELNKFKDEKEDPNTDQTISKEDSNLEINLENKQEPDKSEKTTLENNTKEIDTKVEALIPENLTEFKDTDKELTNTEVIIPVEKEGINSNGSKEINEAEISITAGVIINHNSEKFEEYSNTNPIEELHTNPIPPESSNNSNDDKKSKLEEKSNNSEKVSEILDIPNNTSTTEVSKVVTNSTESSANFPNTTESSANNLATSEKDLTDKKGIQSKPTTEITLQDENQTFVDADSNTSPIPVKIAGTTLKPVANIITNSNTTPTPIKVTETLPSQSSEKPTKTSSAVPLSTTHKPSDITTKPSVSFITTSTPTRPTWPTRPTRPTRPARPTRLPRPSRPTTSRRPTTVPSNTQRPITNPGWFPNLPTWPPAPLLPTFFINPFNTTTVTTGNQTQSTFGFGIFAVPWRWRPNFTNFFGPNRIIETRPPQNDVILTEPESRDLAFWNALFHRGKTNDVASKTDKDKKDINEKDKTKPENPTPTYWKPWTYITGADFLKFPKVNKNTEQATIPANTQVLHLYFPLKYPFQGQIVQTVTKNVNGDVHKVEDKIDSTKVGKLTNEIKETEKIVVKDVGSDLIKEPEKDVTESVIVNKADGVNGQVKVKDVDKTSLTLELELPKPVAYFVNGFMNTFMTPQN